MPHMLKHPSAKLSWLISYGGGRFDNHFVTKFEGDAPYDLDVRAKMYSHSAKVFY